jgi:hypothetical protein
VTSPVTSIECVELYPVKLGRSDYQGLEGGEGETQAPTEKDRRYPSDWDRRTQSLGIKENGFVFPLVPVCRRCETYFETARFKKVDQYPILEMCCFYTEYLCALYTHNDECLPRKQFKLHAIFFHESIPH